MAEKKDRLEGVQIYINTNEVAEICGLSRGTIINMRRDGTGAPYVRLGTRRIAYRLDEVVAWLDSQTSDRK